MSAELAGSFVVAAAALLLYAPAARAQSSEAEVLFREGRQLIKAGQIAEGCAKLDASERLESSIGTLLNLGDCREKLGALASAWAAFRKAEAQAGSGDDAKRQAEAHRRAALIEPRLSYLVLQIDARLDGLVAHRNSEPVDPARWNAAMPVDPGLHELVVEAPGHEPWRTTVLIEARDRRVVAVPPLMDAPAARPSLSPPVVREAVADPAGQPRRAHRTWSTARELAAAFAVAGAGALGAGASFGWRARDLAARSDRTCPFTACGDAEALQLNDRARTAALRANILYAAGGATAVAATILWFAGKPGDTMLQPGLAGGAGVSLSGSF